MDANTRHARLQQIHSELQKALELRAEYQGQVDALHLEMELLKTDCFDEECPCIDETATG